MTQMPEPFEIRTSEAEIADLRRRLASTRWPDEIRGGGWDQGSNLAYVQDLAGYWRDRFDWPLLEARLNRFRHFRAEVEGLKLHFIHERGHGPKPLPLLLIHGWPSSFAEMLKVIPLLTDPGSHGGDERDSFDVVVPSLPGYGYSDASADGGMSIWRAADLLDRLMSATLGYGRYVASGGDWGAYAISHLGANHADHVPAIHLSFVPGGLPPAISPERRPLSKREIALLASRERWTQEEGGYQHLQSTKPQTLAYGLTDSPAGLAAWIVEKIRSWSDCGGDVETVFSRDELLTNISIYWFTKTIGSSMRLYHETRQHPWPPGQRIETPTGIAVFPKELSVPPREWAERIYNVSRWTEMPRGGHFAAAEQPELLVEDVRAFFRAFR